MNSKNTIPRFHHRLHLYILRRLVIYANIMGISTYIFLRVIFHDLPFVLQEELLITLRIVGWSTAIAVGTSFMIFVGHALTYFIRYRKNIGFPTIAHVAEPAASEKSAA